MYANEKDEKELVSTYSNQEHSYGNENEKKKEDEKPS